MSDKKTFLAEKIRTSEICGIDDNLKLTDVTGMELRSISGQLISGQNLSISAIEAVSISGNQVYISGDQVYISGDQLTITDNDGDGSIDLKSGSFDDLIVGGVKYIPRDQLVYAFRFGGPLTEVPNGTPLVKGDNAVFVKDTGIFILGDQIIIDPDGYYGSPGGPQEEHVVSEMVEYYQPAGCCFVTLAAEALQGQTYFYHNKEDNIYAGHLIKFSGNNTLYTVQSVQDQGVSERVDFSPSIEAGGAGTSFAADHCVCVGGVDGGGTLLTEENLFNDYPEGTKVARKYARTTTVLNEGGSGDIYWGNTVLLINSDGYIDDSDIFVDSSLSNHPLTAYGDVHHETDRKKWGSTSIQFDGTNDYLKLPATTDFAFDIDESWTIEMWINFTSNDISYIYSMETSNSHQNADDFRLAWFPEDVYSPGTAGEQDLNDCFLLTAGRGEYMPGVDIVADFTPSLNQWYHIAVVADLTHLKFYIDGTQHGNSATRKAAGHGSHSLHIGTYTTDGGIAAASEDLMMHGYLEDIRITKGVARYTNDFNVPTENFEEFTRGPNTCDSTCYDTQHLYLDVGTYSGLGPSWVNGMGENEPQWDWFLSGYRDHFIDFSGINVHITGNNTHGVLALEYPDEGI